MHITELCMSFLGTGSSGDDHKAAGKSPGLQALEHLVEDSNSSPSLGGSNKPRLKLSTTFLYLLTQVGWA